MLGVVHKWRHSLRGLRGFCDGYTKALVIKTMGVKKLFKNYLTSFINDLLLLMTYVTLSTTSSFLLVLKPNSELVATCTYQVKSEWKACLVVIQYFTRLFILPKTLSNNNLV